MKYIIDILRKIMKYIIDILRKIMKYIIDILRKIFGYKIQIEFEKYPIEFRQFNDNTIKEVEHMYKNTMISLYKQGEIKAAEIVGRELTNIMITYNNIKKEEKI